MAVRFIWASRQCGSLDSEIVRDFRVDLVFAAVGALGGELSHGGELTLCLFLPFSVVDDRSVVAETMIYMPLISFLARVQEDGEVMEHLEVMEHFPF